MDAVTVPTPHCPHCGEAPAFVIDNGCQAFCGNPQCGVIAWDPTKTVAELEANRRDIRLDDKAP